MDTAPSFKPRLKQLILDALGQKYMAESCQDKIQTTNSYQSICLGDQTTPGFRTNRAEYLDRINFRDKKVLDLGCNLGELSRMARQRGAALVDGFEYDSYFLEIGRAVNAYNEVSRVSFYQRDISNPAIYGEHYDVVMAFSVFIYLQRVVQKLAEITDDLLIIETHRLDDNLESVYLKPIGEYFPYHQILGHTEWGTAADPSVRRAVIAFAKTAEKLSSSLKAVASRIGSNETSSAIEIDVDRTVRWFDTFFRKFRFESPEALLASIEDIHIDSDSAAQFSSANSAMSGWVYWLLYVQGYLQYLKAGTIAENNVYYEYLRKYFGPQKRDPGLNRVLADRELSYQRVLKRYQDFQTFREAAVAGEQAPTYQPVTVYQGDNASDAKQIFALGSNDPIVGTVDGYHRLFLARLFGFKKLNALIDAGPRSTAPHTDAPATEIVARQDSRSAQDLKRGAVGALEGISSSEITGWAWSKKSPDAAVQVEILDGVNVIATVLADQFRSDLKQLGYGNGEHQFRFSFPSSIKDGKLHLIGARLADTRRELENSPMPVILRERDIDPGILEVVSAREVIGWAWDSQHPDFSVEVEILEHETVLARLTADQFREDLKNAGLGNGCHGFLWMTSEARTGRDLSAITARISGSKKHLRRAKKLEAVRESCSI